MAPFAHATAAGQTLYVTGQMPTGLDGALVAGGIAEQTDRVLANLARVLELLGGALGDVVPARAYLTDWDEYAEFNAAHLVVTNGPSWPVRWAVPFQEQSWSLSPIPQMEGTATGDAAHGIGCLMTLGWGPADDGHDGL